MPYHPYIEDTDQGERTFLTRQVNESQYGLRMSRDFLVTGIATFSGGASFSGGAFSFPGGGGFSGSVGFPDGIRDSEDGIGGSGQVLSSTGSGLAWINTSAANVGSATSVGINLNNTDADQWLVFAGANSGNNLLRVNNTIRVNPSTGRIGIGTEDPLDQLHIHQVGDNAPKLRIVGVSSNPELNFISPSTGAAVIKFSDDADAAGSITYDHPHNKMKFMIGSTLSFWISPNAHLRLFEALEDATGQAGVAGSVFSSTGSKTAWLPQSSIAAGSLANARTIGGVSFDGTANINLPGVNSAGNQNTSGTAAGLSGNPNITVTDITIEGELVDGDGNFGTSGQVLSSDGTDTKWINVGSIAAGSASSIAVNSNGDNSSQFVTFSEGDSGSQQLRADAGLKYNPNGNALTAGSFVKSGGTSSQFLKADGSTDSNTYVTSNTTYDLSVLSNTTKIRLAGSDSTNDDIEIAGSGTVSVTRTNANKLTITGAAAGTPDLIVEGNAQVECVGIGTSVIVSTQGEERLRVDSRGHVFTPFSSTAKFGINMSPNDAAFGPTHNLQVKGDMEVREIDVLHKSFLRGSVYYQGRDDAQNTSLSGVRNLDLRAEGMFYRYETQPAGDWIPNFQHNQSTVDAETFDGSTFTVTVLVKQRSAGSPEGVTVTEARVDGTSTGVDLVWEGGTAPPPSPGTGWDLWEFVVMKTSSTPTYQVFGRRSSTVPFGMTHSNKTSAYTLVRTDDNRLITTTSNITVPSGVFSPANGTTIYNNSASSITIAPAGGVTLRLSGSNITGTRTLAQRGVCTVMCVASNEFIITGSGLA